MPILRSILSNIVDLRKSFPQSGRRKSPVTQQKKTLTKLLKKARNTEFASKFDFDYILTTPNPMRTFQRLVPIHDYSSMYKHWWHRTLDEVPNVTWPGLTKYFALSSGTSESASKHIPVTQDMLKAIKRTGFKQLLALAYYDLPEGALEKGVLMVGGSTELINKGSYYEGDLSGITVGNIPVWFNNFYKPGKEIAKERDWTTKIEMIIEKAPEWDISVVCGVPAWIQIIFQKIIERHNLRSIHDIWPHMSIYIHGGVSFEPYRKGFDKLFAKKVVYIDTYLASEGFIAYQNKPDSKTMQLVLDNGIFMEFIPFTERNFDENGQLVERPETLLIDEVKEGVDYALLISTCAGAWRYLIGDTIKFISVRDSEIIITGRTKHYLSLVGEHLSVDNMTRAVEKVSEQLNISIPEFTVAGIRHDGLFAHHWYLGSDDKANAEQVRVLLDETLKELNDDYAVERKAALKEVFVDVLPLDVFYGFMKSQGKEGGQNKFPRVLKDKQLENWHSFLQQHSSKL
jgi:hypothetical protein